MNDEIIRYFLRLPRTVKQSFMVMADVVMLITALWLAFSMRYGGWYVIPSYKMHILWIFAAVPIVSVPIFIKFGLYRAIVRYIGFKALWVIVQAVTLYSLLLALLVLLSGFQGVPRSVILINWLVALLAVGGSRMVVRWWMLDAFDLSLNKPGRTKIVIYGAGSAGMQLATVLSYSKDYRPVAFIDDNSGLHHCHINSLRVYSFTQLSYLIEKKGVSEILLAIPSASKSRRHEIIRMLEPYPVHVRTLPAMADIAIGHIEIDDIKEIDVEDLLGRETVIPNEDLLGINIHNKVVMVTGAGGSIGSELCRQILKQSPKKLILFEQNEFALYSIFKELRKKMQAQDIETIVPILGSVLEEKRLASIYSAYNVQTIYHAAAYKHVPIVENNPVEAIRNNIIGTARSARAAIEANVESFVLISTDKAVRPTNTMGASKRFAELILQGLGSSPEVKTCFSMVRFGNVLGSSGSVIPLFREQIQHGGPVTVTDPKIIRYFMTIPEAAELVIQAGSMAQGGDVFVLDMGEPVKIYELAKKMIRLSGLKVKNDENSEGDIEIRFTGLRHGEKLYEELLIGENVKPTQHPLIMRAEEEKLSLNEVVEFLDKFVDACEGYDQKRVRNLLLESVKGFVPQCGIEDHVYKELERKKGDNVRVLFDSDSG